MLGKRDREACPACGSKLLGSRKFDQDYQGPGPEPTNFSQTIFINFRRCRICNADWLEVWELKKLELIPDGVNEEIHPVINHQQEREACAQAVCPECKKQSRRYLIETSNTTNWFHDSYNAGLDKFEVLPCWADGIWKMEA